MSDDWSNDPDWIAYADHAIDDLFPKLEASAFTLSLVPPTRADVKFCLELGAAIMLDKPIIAIAMPGAKVPDSLRRVAHEVVYADVMTDEGKEATAKIIQDLLLRLKQDLDESDDAVEDSDD